MASRQSGMLSARSDILIRKQKGHPAVPADFAGDCHNRRSAVTSGMVSRCANARTMARARRAPSTPLIRSSALASTSAWVIGLSAVPRTARVRVRPASVARRHLDDRLPPRPRMHQLFAGHDRNPPPQRKDFGILHACPVVNRIEGERPVDQQHRQRCWTLTSGIGALSTVRAERVGRWTVDGSISEGPIRSSCINTVMRIERRLRRRADRPFLDIGVQDLEAFSESSHSQLGIGIAAHRPRKNYARR